MDISPELFKELSTVHDRLRFLLDEILKNHTNVVRILSRVKSIESIKEKLSLKALTSVSDITDLVGFRIIVRTQEDILILSRVLQDEFLVESFASENVGPYYDRAHLVYRVTQI